MQRKNIFSFRSSDKCIFDYFIGEDVNLGGVSMSTLVCNRTKCMQLLFFLFFLCSVSPHFQFIRHRIPSISSSSFLLHFFLFNFFDRFFRIFCFIIQRFYVVGVVAVTMCSVSTCVMPCEYIDCDLYERVMVRVCKCILHCAQHAHIHDTPKKEKFIRRLDAERRSPEKLFIFFFARFLIHSDEVEYNTYKHTHMHMIPNRRTLKANGNGRTYLFMV